CLLCNRSFRMNVIRLSLIVSFALLMASVEFVLADCLQDFCDEGCAVTRHWYLGFGLGKEYIDSPVAFTGVCTTHPLSGPPGGFSIVHYDSYTFNNDCGFDTGDDFMPGTKYGAKLNGVPDVDNRDTVCNGVGE